MRLLHSLAGFILFFELPIPIYWLMIHPLNSFWRKRVRAAFSIAGLAAWITGGILLWTFHSQLMTKTRPSWQKTRQAALTAMAAKDSPIVDRLKARRNGLALHPTHLTRMTRSGRTMPRGPQNNALQLTRVRPGCELAADLCVRRHLMRRYR